MTNIGNTDDYFVFISYSSKDEELAKWLQFELEHYHLPATLGNNPRIRKNLRKVFRDRTELSAGALGEQIEQALANSTHLVVVCSPNSAKSHWVDLEVKNFIRLHDLKFDGTDKNKILPFIIEGESPNDYFTPTIIKLRKNSVDLLGGDINKDGKDGAFVKIVSGLLNQKFDALWQRYAREKAEEERRERERKDNLLRLQSLYLAERSMAFVKKGSPYRGCAYALEALPSSISEPGRPIVSEAKEALYKSVYFKKAVLGKQDERISKVIFNDDKRYLISSSWDASIKMWEIETGRLVREFKKVHEQEINCIACMRKNNKEFLISASFDSVIVIWDLNTGELLKRIKTRHPKLNSIATYRNSLIVSYGDGAIAIYDLSDINGRMKPYYLKDSHKESVLSVACDGKFIVSGSIDKTVRVWDFRSRILLKILNEDHSCHDHWITSVSVDNDLIVSTSMDKTIQQWETKTWKPKKPIKDSGDYLGGIQAITVYSDFLISGSDENLVKIWSLDGKNLLTLAAGSSPVLSVAYNGKYLVAGDATGAIHCYMIRKAKVLYDEEGLGVSVDVLYTGLPTGIIHEWEKSFTSVKPIISFDEGGLIDNDTGKSGTSSSDSLSVLELVRIIRVTQDRLTNKSLRFIVCANGLVLSAEGDRVIRVRDVSTGNIYYEGLFDEEREVYIRLHNKLVKLEKVASSSSGFEVVKIVLKAFNPKNKQWIEMKRFSEFSDYTFDFARIEENCVLCKTLGFRQENYLIDLYNWNCINIPIIADTIRCFSLHNDTFFYSRGNTNSLYFYNITTQKKKMFMRTNGKVTGIKCYKEALVVCSNNNSIYVIDYTTKQVIRMINTSCEWEDVHLNGNNLLVKSWEDVSVYDVVSGELIYSIALDYGDVCSADENNIVVGRSEGKLFVFEWPVSFQELVRIKKAQFKDYGLSDDERKQYYIDAV